MGKKVFSGIVALAFLYIAFPFLFPIAMGGVLAVLFSPALDKMERKGIPNNWGAAVLTLAITVVLILPSSLFIFYAVKTAFSQLQAWKSPAVANNGLLNGLLVSPKIQMTMRWVTRHLPMSRDDLAAAFQDAAVSIGARLTEFLGGVLSHLPGMAVGLALIVMSVYFSLADGKKLSHFLRRNSVFSSQQTEDLMQTVAEMCRSVILAAVASGGIQAMVEFFACIATGTPHAGFIGLLVFMGSFIPLVGSSPITLAVAIHQLLEGREAAGITLFIMVLLTVGIDNTVRPLFLRGAANLHPLLGFVAAFGGLQTMGFLGVFLGPILAALFVSTARILIQNQEGIDR